MITQWHTYYIHRQYVIFSILLRNIIPQTNVVAPPAPPTLKSLAEKVCLHTYNNNILGGCVQGWPEPLTCTVYDRILGDFPAKNTVYTP